MLAPPKPGRAASRGTTRLRQCWSGLLVLLCAGFLSHAAHAVPDQRANFDHLTTGFELLGQHRDLPCESCHANAIFKGTPKACGSCHGIGTAIRATAKPASHILSTDQCQGCHTPIGWKPALSMIDHTQVRGGCSTCHNGATAQGKPANHIQTDLECDVCHTTLSWGGAVFVHKGISSNCARCHDGVQAKGVTPDHIPIQSGGTAVACESCHSNSNFVSFAGTVINHQGAGVPALRCASCHETAAFRGMHATSAASPLGDSRPPASVDAKHVPASDGRDCGVCHDTTNFTAAAVKPADHIPTNAPCIQCHTTGAYAVYSVTGTHAGVTSCLACHGANVGPFANVTIVGIGSTNHFPIGNLDCNGSGCHTTANVNPGGFRLGAANVNTPTLNVAGHGTVAGAVPACQTCHESAPFTGMISGTAASWGDSRPTSAYDRFHPTTGDCSSGGCHSTTPTFASNASGATKPAGHIPTTAPCVQCHTTAGNYATYSVTGTHKGVTDCLSCHGSTVNTTFLNVTPVTTPGNHIPIGTLDCNGSGCHTTTNVNPGGFRLGSANINTPTLDAAGHVTVAGAEPVCLTCHENGTSFLGMLPTTSKAAPGDTRPTLAVDPNHSEQVKDCGGAGGCHSTTPVFANDLLPTAGKPVNHIPTNAPCGQCHTTAGDYSKYSVTGTHAGVTTCLNCHGPTVNTTFYNVTMVTTPGNHIPIGALDCNGSGCHTIANVNPDGFRIGVANINVPTLNVAGHQTIAAALGAGCQNCHESAPYVGMVASTGKTAGDSRPSAALDAFHPATGDCASGGCHSTTPTFAGNQAGGTKPSNHIPTTAPCAQCHTTAGNYAVYSVTGTHIGVTTCLACHGTGVGPFANVTIVGVGSTNHFPIGNLDCNGSGCHTTANVNPGGFKLGTANVNTPTLSVAGHTTVKAVVPACQSCHESAPYAGMIVSTASGWGDSRPTAFDKSHPTTGDCGGTCHTTTAPTFASNVGGGAKPANHIPTSGACNICHTTPGNYAAYTMGAAGHAVTTPAGSGCATCHAYGLSFANMSAASSPPLAAPLAGSSGHIPVVPPNGGTAIACELCHSPTVFTTFRGTLMKHSVVSTMKCMACHEFGMNWQVSVGTCTTCTRGQIWMRPDPGHESGNDCNGGGCHSVPTSLKRQVRPAAKQTAAQIQQARTASKSGATATSVPQRALMGFLRGPRGGLAVGANGMAKPADHPATSDSCQSCHLTSTWLPLARMDHSQTRATCASCHNGQIARAKPSSHVPTNGACESCHTTNAWTPARFDHAGVAAHSCASCHNGLKAPGLPRAHVPTTQSCDTCHGTLAWKPAKVDHSHLVTACASCHNNTAAVGLSPGHLATKRDCATCHAYPDWAAVHFVHTSASFPGSHRAALTCTSCHTTDAEQIPWPSAADAGTCGGCHAKDFKPAAHPKTAKGEVYGAHELQNCSGACHVYSDATRAVVTRSLPGPYHRVNDAHFKH